VQLGNKLYEFGGYNKGNNQVTRETSVLDFETGQWTLLAPIPPGAAQSHAGVATDGTYIYWAGGQFGGSEDITQLIATENVWRYEIATNTWSRYVNLPRPILAAGMTIFNGVLYLVGGVEHPELAQATTDHFALNTRSRNPSWIDRAPLPRATDHAGVIEVDGTIYAIGGEHGHGTTYTQHADVYAYNPWEDTWTRKADMPVASSHFDGSSIVIGKRILVAGGRTDLPDFTTAQVRVYDTELDQWTVLNPLPFDRLGGFVGIFNDRIFFTNGYSRVQGLAAESFWGDLEGFVV
jgi:N-acetylneuraminic acid mutarotase